MFRIKSLSDAEKLVLGSTIMGTGGGGSPETGLKILKEIIDRGEYVEVIDIGEAPRDKLIVTMYFIGSMASKEKVTSIKNTINDPIIYAFEKYSEFLGEEVGALIPVELGGSNTPIVMKIASRLNLPVIDGDLAGRAVPELHQCSVLVFGGKLSPSIIVTDTGNVVFVKEYASIDDYEYLARTLSTRSNGTTVIADTPMSYELASKAIIKNTISLCIKLGNEVIEARNKGYDPVERIIKVLNGWIIFEGIVKKTMLEDKNGFLTGEIILEGIRKYKGHILKSWIKNEHIMVWLDNQPIVMPPDLFILLEKDGTPVINSKIKPGMHVLGIAAKAPSIWRTPKGLELFGPRHFGFNYDYIPVEELITSVLKKLIK